MAELEQKYKAADRNLLELINEINNTLVSSNTFESEIAQPKQDLIEALADLMTEMQATQDAFVVAIQPDQDAPSFYDSSFKTVMTKCGGNESASFANSMGFDSFNFLAREYVRQLLFGIRGTDDDSIYFSFR